MFSQLYYYYICFTFSSSFFFFFFTIHSWCHTSADERTIQSMIDIYFQLEFISILHYFYTVFHSAKYHFTLELYLIFNLMSRTLIRLVTAISRICISSYWHVMLWWFMGVESSLTWSTKRSRWLSFTVGRC